MSSGTIGHAPAFLSLLGLGTDVDVRAVKKAYAQRLKQIDQALDPDGFQSLRTAYEQALRWLDQSGQPGPEAEQTAPEPISRPTEPAPDAAESAANELPGQQASKPLPERPAGGHQALQGFAARLNEGFREEQDARRALEEALAHEELINLEARTQFEWQVARLLAEGWQPGHEYLFGPACACFNWEDDRRRLMVFGAVGAAIDAAISEKMIFFRQSPADFERQRKLIKRLRDPEKPSERGLKTDMHLLHALTQRYPNWLRQVTSQHNIILWHQWFDELQETRALTPEAAKRAEPDPSPPGMQLVLLGIVVFLGLLFALFKAATPERDDKPLVLDQPWQATQQTDRSKSRLPGDDPFVALGSKQRAGQVGDSSKTDLELSNSPRPTSPAEPTARVEEATGGWQSAVVPADELAAIEGESLQLGNVQFTLQAGQWLVLTVEPKTDRVSSSLKPGDRILSCAAGHVHPLRPTTAALQRCALEKRFLKAGDSAQYLFNVHRGGSRTQGLITLRD